MPRMLFIIGVAIMAILSVGCTMGEPPLVPANNTTAVPSGTPPFMQSTSVSPSPGSIPGAVANPFSVPPTGAYLYVSCAGTFSGSFGTPAHVEQVQNTGRWLFPLAEFRGIVSADFTKTDGTDYPMTVTIFGDNTVLDTDTNSTTGGEVKIAANV